ncbi:putative ribonuclease H-like domain-containing protein [Tanacetum coccineum]|uniref:Ribonuclease H-like domain-containing protein n=1 Tax=Tanacetum coccineum TaxID=301880 RepID=A0ABQ5AE66_9ASTR
MYKIYTNLIVKLNETEFKASTYKRDLATVEEQLVTFRKNEVLFGEEITVLKREIGFKDYEISVLKTEFEKVKQEKEGIDFKIAKFDNASKDLDKLLASQITDKSKKGLGYHVVVPPHPLSLNAPTKLDLSYSDISKENTDDSLEKEQVSNNENSSVESLTNVVKETVFHAAKKVEFVKPKNNEKPVRKSVRYAEMYKSQSLRGNQRNWNGQKSNQLGRNPQLNDKGFVDSGCSRHMTGNIAYLSNFMEFDGGHVTFGGGAYGGRIIGKGTLKTDSLDFDDVYFVKELKFNLFSVSQMCDKKNYVLFTDTECLVLSPNFKLPDENQILLKIPREDNMYSFDMKNIIPKESLTCLVAKATLDESMLWHRRLGHINFKSINKLVKENLIRGLPLKRFENDQTCVACLKGKQQRASCKSKVLNPITKPLFMLHKDLFGPTYVSSLMHKKYCLVITDDYSREKGIKREYSIARTPQQNGVAERRNRTLIEANRVFIVKPHNKTPYELFRGFKPSLSFMRPFGCHVTILNTLDHLGKFDGKSDEGLFVGYSLSSKAFRVYNTRTRKVEENLHVGFLKNKPMIKGNGPKWLFDIESLTQSMNYVPIVAGTSSNDSADTTYFDSPSKDVSNDEPKSASDDQKQAKDGPNDENDDKDKSQDNSSLKEDNTADPQVNTASPGLNTGSFELNTIDSSVNTARSKDKSGASLTLEATHLEYFNDEDEPEVDLGNILSSYTVPTTPNTRIHKDHPIKNVIGNVNSSIQTRRMLKPTSEQGFINVVYEGKTHKDLHMCLFACFLSREEPNRITKALCDPAWVEMDVKSVFLYGQIEEEVYVCQPPGFEDPDYSDKVYKVVKALYELHQAPRAWYENLANYLLGNGFQRGKIDLTLFIKKQKGDILLVQIYVDDIIFGSTNKELLQQKKDGIFISQDKYVDEILKKFNYTDVKSAFTPVDLEKPLVKDGDANDVDVHLYRSMIGSLMYLTTSRPDIMFAICACARFQVTPKTSHLIDVKRIFKYLKGKPTLGLWYSRDSPFELVAYTNSDYTGVTQDRKSTTGGCQFLGNKLISWQCKKQTVVATSTTEAEYVAAASCYGQDCPVSVRCQKPGHLAERLGCTETKDATWDDLPSIS